MKTSNEKLFNALHYLWMVPCAIAISPIGTLIFTIAFSLNFIECVQLITAQIIVFLIIGIFSNFGE
jgi:hypothetical protein